LPHLLRDPDDTRTGESVHHFPRNTLNPGLPGTREFLETVFGEVADLFPSPAIHMGCDEVPDGVWDHSPAAQRYAAERGIEGSHAIAKAFMAEIGEIVKATGRRVNVWQEAAEAGSVAPGDGWVGGWKSAADCRTLAAAGFDVIAMPAEAYYLDMATGPEFELPGHFWAGTIDDDTIRDFEPTAGWSDEERTRLVGVMACHFGEHIPDRSTLRRLVYQRLTTFGDAAWRSV
jgi:hexosaminidase